MISPQHTVEELLLLIGDRAALLRHFAECAAAAISREASPDARVFSGLGDACADIEGWARAAHDALDVTALATEIGSGRNRRHGR